MSMNYTGLARDCQIRTSYQIIIIPNEDDVSINEVYRCENEAMRPLASIALASLLFLTAASCSGINDPSKNTVVNFEDTIDPLEGNVYEFDVTTNNGEYSVQLTALSPDSSAGLSIYLGQVVSGLCTPILGQQGTARLNLLALNSPIQKGHYCIQLFDLGVITRTQTYTLRVSHPR